ncbi:MAG: hypothetical protein LBT58_05240 [Endomicrobium sp.]|jgi:hypothetical protein|nr:hypothetical protein [Endomicrobium sp.]
MKKIVSLVMALTLLCSPLERVFAAVTTGTGIINSEKAKEFQVQDFHSLSLIAENKKCEEEAKKKKEMENESWGDWFGKNKSTVIKTVFCIEGVSILMSSYAGFNSGCLEYNLHIDQMIEEELEVRPHHQNNQIGWGIRLRSMVANWAMDMVLDTAWAYVKNFVTKTGTIVAAVTTVRNWLV